MSNRYVRLHTKPNQEDEATLIGMSASAAYVDIANDPSWVSFFSTQGYQVREMQRDNPTDVETVKTLGGISWRCFEVQPPISDEHLSRLGSLCAATISTGNNAGFLIDDRNTPSPFENMDERGATIRYWEC